MATNKLLLVLLTVTLSLVSINSKANDPIDIELEVTYDDPEEPQNPGQRCPTLIPRIGLEGFSVYFNTPCDDCLFRLINEDYEVEYSTIIPSGTHTMVLPSYLSGEYRIEIIRGNFCFWGYIDI